MTHPDTGGGGTSGPGRAVEVFQFPATGQAVRTVLVDGEPWFVLADICSALDIANPRNVAARIPDRRKGVRSVDTPGGRQSITVVDEPGAYMVVMRSDKAGAVAFQEWLAEVATQVRRTGRYEVAPALPQSYAEALRELAATIEEAEQVKSDLAIAAPKAHSWDTLASGDGDYAVADAAKILSRDPVISVGERRLFAVLAAQDWIYRQRADGRWRAYQAAVERGWLSEMPASHYHPQTGDLVLDPPQVRVKPKGLAELHRRLGGLQPLRIHEQTALPAT